MASKRIRIQKENGDKARFQGKTIEIVVGDEQKIFSVHEGLSRASSLFLDKAMAGDWKESEQRTIYLPDDDPKVLALYIHWLYYGTLAVLCDEPGLPGNSEYLDLVKAYVLGDKLLDFAFQDAAVDAIIEKSRSVAQDGAKWYPVGEVIEYAYNNTIDSAPIRELLVDMYANRAQSSWLHDWADPASVPQPFLLGLASKLLDRRERSAEPLEANKYYSHSN
ncbi:hypothetical protein BDV12DRAFT_184709 [Aspergillus spectabilis]